MFEVGFTELLLIFALALIVLGPDKLPRVASQVGRWIGRARTLARQFREQLEEEVDLTDTSTYRRSPFGNRTSSRHDSPSEATSSAPDFTQSSAAPAPASSAGSPGDEPSSPLGNSESSVTNEAVPQPETFAAEDSSRASAAPGSENERGA
jgi:sec-independent protein translocase protein TatB